MGTEGRTGRGDAKPAPARDIVVIGGSAGAVRPAQAIVSQLPSELAATVLVVLHRMANRRDPHGLTQVFASRAALPTQTVRHEQPVERGHVYVAPPDQQLVLENGLLLLQSSPEENLFRPSIDVLLKSAAAAYGRRVIGVLLSGALGTDGPAGIWQVKHRGGIAIVQDPSDAEFPMLPKAAIDKLAVDHILPAAQIASTLVELTSGSGATHASAARILIVEDESVVAMHLEQSLVEMGYHVIDWVPSGAAALELAEREHPDLILMDIHLAGTLTGIQAARKIWQTRQIPVVYCTAHADLETLKAVHTTEAYGYVVKPFRSDDVRVAIELALARREKELR